MGLLFFSARSGVSRPRKSSSDAESREAILSCWLQSSGTERANSIIRRKTSIFLSSAFRASPRRDADFLVSAVRNWSPFSAVSSTLWVLSN